MATDAHALMAISSRLCLISGISGNCSGQCESDGVPFCLEKHND